MMRCIFVGLWTPTLINATKGIEDWLGNKIKWKKKFRPLGGNSPESAWHHSAEAGGIMSLVLTDKSVQESVLELVEDSIVIVIVIEVIIHTIVVVIELTG